MKSIGGIGSRAPTKWWRQRRAEMEKDVSRTVGKINISEENVLFSEIQLMRDSIGRFKM